MDDLIDPTPLMVHGRGPDWLCVADEQPWPCDPAREELVRLFGGRRHELRMLMGHLHHLAQGDLILPAGEFNDRFLRWLRPLSRRVASRSIGARP
jgi:hypothetical protein